MNLGEENEEQEFKESLAHLKEGLKSLSAMLNRHGHGTVYYGVKDDGSIKGLTISKKTLVDVRADIKQLIEPQIMPVIEDLSDEDGRHFIKVSANGYNKPYSCDGRFYLRTAASDEKVTTEILRRMLVSGTTDLISEMDSENQELTFDGFVSYMSTEGIHARKSKSFYQSSGLINAEGKYNMMAYLMSDQNEMNLKVVRFAGTDKTVMQERNDYGSQCLLLSVDQVFDYVTSFISTKVMLADGSRQETKLFDKESFREAWYNACVHNAWSEKLAPSVYMYDDRIEIVSYGTIPFDLSLDGFYSGTSVPVNNGLFSIFSNAHFTEQSGHGIPTIVEHYGKNAFSFRDNILMVTLKYSFEPESVTVRKEQKKKERKLTDNQLQVLKYLASNPSATLAQAADKNGLSLSGTKKIVKKLRELGIIERTGSKRDGKWKIKVDFESGL